MTTAPSRPETVDLADGAASVGTLALFVRNPRMPYSVETMGGKFTVPKSAGVAPLVAVDGRPVRLGRGMRVHVKVTPGPHVVEVMDDQQYESRTVSVDEDGSASVWIGVGLLRSEPRIYLGSQEYAACSTKVDRVPEQIAAAASLVTLVLASVSVFGWLDAIAAVPEHVPILSVLALAVVVFWPVRQLARALLRRRPPGDIGAPGPEPVSDSPDPAHPTTLVPRAATLPDADTAICLRFRAEPKALARIRIWQRSGGKRRRMPYFSNSRVDWLAAPEVTVNGQRLPPRWGTWWIPVRPGQVRIRVHLPGFVNGQFRGPAATAEIDTTVTAGHVRQVEARYNNVALAAERLEARPDAEAEWQRALRERNRLAKTVKRARAPRLALRAGASKKLSPGTRLPR